jgi:selenocysteine lyase/cysteine desulfurase
MLVVVDGVHGLAADTEPVSASSYDVLVAGTHKWLGGPRGTGLVWSEGAWSRLTSAIPSFHADRPGAARFTPGGYHSFEHRWALAEAFDFAAAIGRERIAERVTMLATRLKQGLAEIPEVRLITPLSPEVSAGIVCFEVDGLEPPDAVARLREHRVAASVTPYATPYVRLGTGLWVDEADVDAALDAVAGL